MAPRILLVDDEESVRTFCAEVLGHESVEIVACATAEDALDVASGARFDLFLFDINLPRMTGFQLREKVRAFPGGNAPVLFLTGADAGVEMEIARSLKGEKLLMKPIAPADLRRAVKVALKLVRAEAGPMPESFDRITSIVARDAESGVLTASAGTTIKRVVFRDGKVAFAASNDPREVIGQAFVRSGLITEKDLAAALSHREASGGKPLGVVLTALRKITREQADKVFAKKIRESVLELFLWKGGMVEFVASVEEADQPFPIALDLDTLITEGKKRRSRWTDVQQTLPDPSVKFSVKRWPSGFPKNEGDRVLAKHVESGRSMAEIMVELRGQDYAVGVRLAELVRAGALEPSLSRGFSAAPIHDSVTVDVDEALSAFEEFERPRDVDDGSGPADEIPKLTRVLPTPPPSLVPNDEPVNLPADSLQPVDGGVPSARPEDSPTFRAPQAAPRVAESVAQSVPPQGGMPETMAMLTRALVLMRAGDLAAARAGLIEVLSLDPMNPLARQRLIDIEEALASQFRGASGLSPETRVQLAVRLEELVGKPIQPNDAFVLTRLAGTSMTIGELIQICPLPENEIWQVIQRHLESGILARA